MLKKLTKAAAILAAIALILIVFTLSYVQNLKSNISDNLLRLHIVGASNSDYDQHLKIRVRDKILADFSNEFIACNSAQEAADTAALLKYEIEKSANAELARLGSSDTVTSTVEKCKFPTKTYESLSLPGGEYTALNIRIGNASGKNWWCVMYPPLCVTDRTMVMSKASEEKLKSSLSEEEYRLICENDKPDIKIKFKIAEILGEYLR